MFTPLGGQDLTKVMYRRVLFVLLVLLGFIFFLGESWNYYRAYRFIGGHRKEGELIIADMSAFWKHPKLGGAIILRPHEHLPERVLRVRGTIWVLEQEHTLLPVSLPASWECEEHRFGWWNRYLVKRCHSVGSDFVDLTERIRQAWIRLDGRRCVWRGGKCRFGPSWRWVGIKDDFLSGGIKRHCIFAHPHAGQWMEIHFPVVFLWRSFSFFYGFLDNRRSSTPMRLQIFFEKRVKGGEGKVLRHLLWDRWIPHAPGWRELKWSKSRLNRMLSGHLVVRFWSRRVGAKSFCFKPIFYGVSAKGRGSVIKK